MGMIEGYRDVEVESRAKRRKEVESRAKRRKEVESIGQREGRRLRIG